MSKEIDPPVRNILATRIHANTCFFADELDVFGDGVSGASLYNQAMSLPLYQQKKKFLFESGVSHQAWCLTHNRLCNLSTGAACRVGGPPCVDWSAAGDKLGYDGRTLPTFFAYGAKCQSTSTLVACLENVPEMPLDLAVDNLSPKFSVEQYPVWPALVGFEFVRRPRCH